MMSTKHDLLNAKRQKSLTAVATATARRHNQGIKAAREAAARETRRLLEAEVRARIQADAKAHRASKARPVHSTAPDLFQGLH